MKGCTATLLIILLLLFFPFVMPARRIGKLNPSTLRLLSFSCLVVIMHAHAHAAVFEHLYRQKIRFSVDLELVWFNLCRWEQPWGVIAAAAWSGKDGGEGAGAWRGEGDDAEKSRYATDSGIKIARLLSRVRIVSPV